jgi:hypothetical protein
MEKGLWNDGTNGHRRRCSYGKGIKRYAHTVVGGIGVRVGCNRSGSIDGVDHAAAFKQSTCLDSTGFGSADIDQRTARHIPDRSACPTSSRHRTCCGRYSPSPPTFGDQ